MDQNLFSLPENSIENNNEIVPWATYRADLSSGKEKLLFISKAAETITGYSVNELLDNPDIWPNLTYLNDKPRVEEAVKRVSPQNSELSISYRGNHKAGFKRWFFKAATTTFDYQSNPLKSEGVIFDITKQKQKEGAHEIANRVFDDLSQHHNTLTDLANLNKIFQDALEQLLGLTDASAGFICEIMGKTNEKVKFDLLAECKVPGPGAETNLNSLISLVFDNQPKALLLHEFSNIHSTKNEALPFLGLPLLYDKTVVGAIGIIGKSGGFSENDVRLLHPVAGILSTFIGNFQKEKVRKRTELRVRGLNQALKQFKFALHHASIISITDTKGIIRYANKNFSKISLYSHDELIGNKHSIINSGHFPRSFWKGMWKTIGKGQIWRDEIKNKAKDGSYYWVDTFIVPLKDAAGKVNKFMSIRYDITKRKKYEERLNLLSMIASQTLNYVIMIDTEQKIEWINRSFELATNYRLEEVKGLIPWNLLYGEGTSSETVEFISKMLDQGEPCECEIKYYKKNGESFWVRMNIHPIQDESHKITGFFAIMNNITDEKNLIKWLDLARRKAEESDRLKSAFIANMSHEIRTPMNAIMGISELLDKQNLPENKKMQLTKLIRERSRDLLSIVNDILDISRIEAGEVSGSEEKGNLLDFLDQLFVRFSGQVQRCKKLIDIKMYCELRQNEAEIMADFNHLQQVFNNLFSNALKFTDVGTIEFGCDRVDEKTVRFSIRDTGKGIPVEKQEVIFKPFRQADTSVHQLYGGTGLGLSIAKGYVELWGGKISVESNEKGSVFYFTMPYKRA